MRYLFMIKADKLLARMRQNPAGDWTIQDIERLCSGLGWRCLPPTGGGSHWKVMAADEEAILTIPGKAADQAGLCPQTAGDDRKAGRWRSRLNTRFW
jgi:hypothetical protein